MEKFTSNADRASAAVDAVATLYPAQVVKPSSTAFTECQGSFWNAPQRQKSPACFFQPTNSAQVRAAIVEVARAGSPFAIKGGGHSASGGSSCYDGVQFDLVNLSHIDIADDKQTVRVGPGVRWGPLLQTLEKEGVIAVGGRDFGVGVPGFVFGGGLSYLSAQYGWGIDNLVSSDIVLANGDLITVDSASHPDLNQALRGGGAHNFGIVTSLTLKIYPYKGMWGGVNVVAEKHFDAFFDEYDTYTRNLVKDGKAHMILDFVRKDGEMVAAQFVGYPDSLPNPHIYDGFRRIPSVMNTLRLADYSALAAEVAEVTDSGGQRNGYWTTAMEYDINLLKAVYKLWAEKTETCRMKTVLDFNHITPGMRNKAAREGKRNLYGLEGPDEPLSNILLTATWDNESDDEEAASLLKSLGDAIDDLARRHGKSLQFRYMNYANQQQDVIAGLGAENKAFLIEAAAKYDPEAVFQKLQPGTFKIDASGSGTSIL